MNRDLSISKSSNEFAWCIKNMRVLATNNNTSFSLINEKGVRQADISRFQLPIGVGVLGDTAVIWYYSGLSSIWTYKFN